MNRLAKRPRPEASTRNWACHVLVRVRTPCCAFTLYSAQLAVQIDAGDLAAFDHFLAPLRRGVADEDFIKLRAHHLQGRRHGFVPCFANESGCPARASTRAPPRIWVRQWRPARPRPAHPAAAYWLAAAIRQCGSGGLFRQRPGPFLRQQRSRRGAAGLPPMTGIVKVLSAVQAGGVGALAAIVSMTRFFHM